MGERPFDRVERTLRFDGADDDDGGVIRMVEAIVEPAPATQSLPRKDFFIS